MVITGNLVDDFIRISPETQSEGKPVKRAYAYARISSEMQDERGSTIEFQLEQIKEFAEKRGFEIVEEFHEVGSAFNNPLKRSVFLQMLSKIENSGRIDAVIVHDFSRFMRKGTEGMSLKKKLAAHGTALISVIDPELDPEADATELIESIIFWNNEYYSKKVSKDTQKGCKKNARVRDKETGWCYWNGGQPIWGYKIRKLDKGVDSSGKPIMKSIVVPDDRIVNGKPVWEWAKYCLEELVAKGQSLDHLVNFCIENGIPTQRGGSWNTSTWNSLLQPYVVLKYAGYGIYNIHNKDGSFRSTKEWVFVEKAHESIISEETARIILNLRSHVKERHNFDSGYSRSKNSPYLLSGGLFKCGTCGKNMQGIRKKDYDYYICGSQPNRKNCGCGSAVYVPKDFIEKEVIDGILGFLDEIIRDPKFVKCLNRDLERIHKRETGFDSSASRKIKDLERKIDNVFDAIGNGLEDVDSANKQISKWRREIEKIRKSNELCSDPPQIDRKAAASLYVRLKEVLANGEPKNKKALLRILVSKIELAPEELKVKIRYALPEPLVHSNVAGGGFEPPTSGL